MNRFNDVLPEIDERPDGKGQCHECHKFEAPDEMAQLNGYYFCSSCLDPKQPAFDYLVSMIEHMAADIIGLKAERRRLSAENNQLKRRNAA